ncbi:MAG TPA: oxidoreductase, partial [Candidatus Wallbacteria bacterium]|nr:oxidoreductase [Candidatus Wallbacteria bacterium]
MTKTATKTTEHAHANFVNAEMFVPKMAKINRVETFTEKETFFELSFQDGTDLNHKPGQFVEVSIFGVGEAPISISSPPTKKGAFDLCVRNAGMV